MRCLAVLLAALAVIAAVAAGCGQFSGSGTAGRCEPGAAMPAPALTARQYGYEIRIRYRFPKDACLPWGLMPHVASRDRPDNLGSPKRGGEGARVDSGSGLLRSPRRSGTLTYWQPLIELPPYEVSLIAVSERGERGPRSVVLVGRPECTRERPLADCFLAARTQFERCTQGIDRRAACHPDVWRRMPWPQTTKLRTRPRKLEASLRESLGETGYPVEGGVPGDYGKVSSLSCSSSAECVVSYTTRSSPEMDFTVRYTIRARTQVPNCWVAVRTELVRRPRDKRLLDKVAVVEGPTQQPDGCFRG